MNQFPESISPLRHKLYNGAQPIRRAGTILWLAIILLALHIQPALADVPPGCVELIRNNSFEAITGDWVAQPSSRPPAYVNISTPDGSAAMQLGIVDLANTASNSIIEQTVVLPTTASNIVLSFRYYTYYDGPNDAGDYQYLDIYNVANGQFVARAFQELRNDRTWLTRQFDLTNLRGQQIRLLFGVNNDGNTGKAAMYIDSVSLLSCSPTPVPVPATTTPTLIPSPTFTPAPPTLTFTPLPPVPTFTPVPVPTGLTGCTNMLVDGSFEGDGTWIFGEDPLPGRYVTSQHRGGTRSVVLGSPPELGRPDVYSYSSVRQLVTLPNNVSVAQLRWWQLLQTQESPDVNHPSNNDCHEVILLTPNLKTLAILQRVRRNDGGWVENAIDLTPFRGQSFYVYFNVVNDGDGIRTWSYLDDVSLAACFSAAPALVPAVEAAPALPTPVVINPTPVLSSPPIATAEQIVPVAPAAVGIPAPTVTPGGPALAAPAALAAPLETVSVEIAPQARSLAGVDQAVLPAETPTPAPSLMDRFFSWWSPAPTEAEVPVTAPVAAESSTSRTIFTRLGTVAVLLAVLVVIALLATAILRMLRF